MSLGYLTWAMNRTDIPAEPRLVLIALADLADDTGHAWPSDDILALKVGMNADVLAIHLRWLYEAGTVKRRQDGGRPLYQLCDFVPG